MKFSVPELKALPFSNGMLPMLWEADKTRRVDASGHSSPRKHIDKSQSPDNESEEFDWSISDWDNWLETDSDSDKESQDDLHLSS